MRRSWRGVVAALGLVVAGGAAAQSFPSHWESRGAGAGGALMDPSFSPHDDRLFVACDMSELFRSTDLGRHWSDVDHRQIQGNRGTRVGFTSDPQQLFAIDQTDELPVPAHSSDGGLSWQRAPTSAWPADRAAIALFVDRRSTQRLLVATYDALYLSTDGGAHFVARYSTADGNGVHVGGVLFDGTEVYAGTSQGVLRSTGGGAFSTMALGGLPAGSRIVGFAAARGSSGLRMIASTADAATVYAGMLIEEAFGAWRGSFRLEPGASNWVAASTGIAAGDQPVLVAMPDDDSSHVFLAGAIDPNLGEAPVVYRSSDGGQSFTSVLGISHNANVATGWAGAGGDRGWSYGGGLIGLGVAPNDWHRVAISDYGFVHVSEDGGAHWRQAYVDPVDQHPEGADTPPRMSYHGVGLENTSVWSLAWADPTHLFAGFTDLRGLRSSDGGASWGYDFSGHSDNSMYRVVADPNGVLYGATSTVHDLYESRYLGDARIDGGGGSIKRSTDQGRTWTTVHDFGHVTAWIALAPNDPNRAYAAVAHSVDGGVWTTANLSAGAASTWTRLPAPPRTVGHAYNVVALNDGAIVATWSGHRDAGGIFLPRSGVFYRASPTAPWEDRSDAGMRYWTKDITVDPADPSQNTWYVAVFSGFGGDGSSNGLGGLYRSRDRGLSWTRINASDRVESLAIHPTLPGVAFMSTEIEGLWRTSNLAAATPDFVPDPSYPFRQPLRVLFNPYDTAEAWVTSFGGGLRVGRFGTTVPSTLFADGFE